VKGTRGKLGARSGAVPAMSRMAAEVRAGLLSEPPTLPSKYFYDDTGSALFEEITRLPEYYQTRTEEALLASVASDLVERARPDELIELGSGAGRKIRTLLDAAHPRRLTLLDINRRFLEDSARRLSADYPTLEIATVVGDFTEDLEGLRGMRGSRDLASPRRLAILFAGTIGNLLPTEVPGLLSRVAARLRPGDCFLVGVDVVKDPRRLEEAYNDAAGVTAAFNLNVLAHVNRELGADFDLAQWRHRAIYDRSHDWIEMRLVSATRQRVRIPAAALELTFDEGDEIVTEYSCKYSRDSFTRLLRGTGFALDRWYTDPEELFALALLRRQP
jgi:L-histidine Nalpha-methyltransferase